MSTGNHSNGNTHGACFLYIAKCADGTLYVGYTRDLEKGMRELNLGRGAAWSRQRRPISLVASWSYESLPAARRVAVAIRLKPDEDKLAFVRGDAHPGEIRFERTLKPSRSITCTKCGKQRNTVLTARDVCITCYNKEPGVRCSRCNRMSHLIVSDTGLCAYCFNHPISQCANCSRTRAVYDKDPSLCRACYDTRRKKLRPKVTCSGCGKVAIPDVVTRAICKNCLAKERMSREQCRRCHKDKFIFRKGKSLCRQCYIDTSAPQSLTKYVTSYTTPHPYNKKIFDLLVGALKWESVIYSTECRVRAFGRFLQNNRLVAPLTWNVIYESLPPFADRLNRTNIKHVRSCLIDCGHLLAAQGEMESRTQFMQKRGALLPAAKAPSYAQPIIDSFVTWLEGRRAKPVSIGDHLASLTSFWSWCDRRGIRLPEGVRAADFENYLVTLYEQWRCSACEVTTEVNPFNRTPPRVCLFCNAIDSTIKIRRYAQHTVRQERSKLRVFFDWAKINRLVIANPIKRKVKAPAPTIHHYPPEVLEALAADLLNPEADPTEALILYLIIFHAFSIWELRHAQLPTVSVVNSEISSVTLEEAYYLIVPRPEPSLGKLSPGRPSTRVDFIPELEDSLKPLLRRVEEQRKQRVKNINNRYLLVCSTSSVRAEPVNRSIIIGAVSRASARVLGAHVTPGMLRKTTGIIFTECGGPTALNELGWSEEQAWGYNWQQRIIIQP